MIGYTLAQCIITMGMKGKELADCILHMLG